jgi:trigger factor
MKVAVESLDRVRKNVEVILDEERISEIREGVYAELKKHAKVKGFRPGKVPKSVLQSFYKEYVDEETKRKMVEETMGDALSETHVEPLSEPRIEFLEEKPGYKMEVEVEPEFDLPSYEGIEAEVEKAEVTEEDVHKRLEAMREMHAQLAAKEGAETVANGDFVIVRYEGFHNGKPVKDVKSDSYPIDLADPHVMPEFASGLMGAKIGEEKEIELKFADDYPDKDIAGKPILMKVTVKEIKEKKLPEVNDDFAKDLGFENTGVLREEVRKGLEKEQESKKKNLITQQIAEYLIKETDIPVPERLLRKRVDALVEDARTRMKTGALTGEAEGSFNAALQKEYEPEAAKRLKMEMILAKIAEKEGITVGDSEVDERVRRIAEETKRGYDYVKDFYEKYKLKENLKQSLLEEKTVGFLVEKAQVKEKA